MWEFIAILSYVAIGSFFQKSLSANVLLVILIAFVIAPNMIYCLKMRYYKNVDLSKESVFICHTISLGIVYNLPKNVNQIHIPVLTLSIMILAHEYCDLNSDWIGHRLVFFFCIMNVLKFISVFTNYINCWKIAIYVETFGYAVLLLSTIRYSDDNVAILSLFLFLVPFLFPLSNSEKKYQDSVGFNKIICPTQEFLLKDGETLQFETIKSIISYRNNILMDSSNDFKENVESELPIVETVKSITRNDILLDSSKDFKETVQIYDKCDSEPSIVEKLPFETIKYIINENRLDFSEDFKEKFKDESDSQTDIIQ